jgi:hypothetical protein
MVETPIPLANLSDAELERALAGLGGALVYPVTPDIAATVRERIETEPHPSHVSSLLPFGRQRMWLAVAIVLLAILAGLVLFPEARTAIADRLGLRGVQIGWLDEPPTPEAAPVGARLLLGQRVTLDEAQAAVDFPVHRPMLPAFAHPPEVYLAGQGRGPMISFVYPAGPELPATDETGVGALLTQFPGNAERNLITKGLRAGDGEDGSTLEAVTVDGQPGFWITGAPHAVFFVCYDEGECREERYRLAGNVLLWEMDGLTLRLESGLGRDQAMAVAASVAPGE